MSSSSFVSHTQIISGTGLAFVILLSKGAYNVPRDRLSSDPCNLKVKAGRFLMIFSLPFFLPSFFPFLSPFPPPLPLSSLSLSVFPREKRKTGDLF